MAVSVRLDPLTEALLTRLATERGVTRSAIIRDALHRYASAVATETPDRSVLDRVIDLVGSAADGPEDLAERHRELFRERLGSERSQVREPVE